MFIQSIDCAPSSSYVRLPILRRAKHPVNSTRVRRAGVLGPVGWVWDNVPDFGRRDQRWGIRLCLWAAKVGGGGDEGAQRRNFSVKRRRYTGGDKSQFLRW